MTETYLKIDGSFMQELKKQFGLFKCFRFRKVEKELMEKYGEGSHYSSSLENNGIHVANNTWEQDNVYAYRDIKKVVESNSAYTFVTKNHELVFVGKNGLNETAFKTYVKRLFDAHILTCESLPASF